VYTKLHKTEIYWIRLVAMYSLSITGQLSNESAVAFFITFIARLSFTILW